MAKRLLPLACVTVAGCIETEPEPIQILTPPIRVVSVDEVFEGEHYPDLHISLRGANDNWCMLSITKAALDAKEPPPNSKPTKPPTEIDCIDEQTTYIAHSGMYDAYVTMDSTPQPDGSYQLNVFARMQAEGGDQTAELGANLSISAPNQFISDDSEP